MSPDLPGRVTNSFALLQRLRQSFSDLAAGRPARAAHKRTLLRIAAGLGATAVPLCARELASTSNLRSQWAYQLLVQIAQEADAQPRVIRALRELCTDGTAPDASKMRCMALLTDLDADERTEPVLDDAVAVERQTLVELCGNLETHEQIARSVDTMVHNTESDELLDLIEALSEAEPARTRLVLDEMLARADMDERFRGEVRRLRAPLMSQCKPALVRAARGPVRTLIARRDDDRTLIVASQRRPGSKPARWRTLSCLLDEHGRLIDALHQGDHTRTGVDRELVAPLRDQGYEFRDATPEEARALLCRAARATASAGGQLASDYYIGRDLLAIHDEHLATKYKSPRDVDPSALLARAVDLLAMGENARALPLLERCVAAIPGDAHACSNLGLCLLSFDELKQARIYLERAVAADPDSALHHWNLASCAHRENRLGACYLALVDYLCLRDQEPETETRRTIAGAFVSEYERFARLEFPAASPDQLARAEDYLFRAREMGPKQVDARIALLTQAVQGCATHHPSWAELGTAYADARRLSDARRCLERALALHTDFPPALEALQLVIQLLAKRYPEPRGRRARKSQRATASGSGARSRRSEQQRRR